MVNAVGMTFGALFLFGLTLATATTIEMPRLADTWWAMAYMVVIGSGLVFTLYVWVLERWDASRANYGFVVIPIATLLISAWLTGEEITAGLTGGGLLVVAGVYFGALRPMQSGNDGAEAGTA